MTEKSEFLRALKKKKNKMSAQEYRTLKGQALKGDINAASKGMSKVVRRRGLR
ncbi:hypothetical protein [Butyrivibrio sp. MB2005]|uniref:hypothetical protein n=1 Tax=Butyrivibrio sp. MB2005 TaxID=1280678 RepID=UPI0003F97209|nr:hypothetical protein [Butyrivibrio sp. MB2005]